jgi:Secretion system C-terminal sorting domain
LGIEIESEPGTSQFPSSGCNSITPPASFSEIQAVCNSYQYTNRRDQFFKAPKNGEADTQVRGKNNGKTNMELQILPNPANMSLEVQYAIKASGKVKIGLYDLAGKMVKSLAKSEDMKEGYYTLQADLTDVPSGMYLVLLDFNGKTETKKLSVIKR